MKLDPQDIAYAEKVEEEHIAEAQYRLYLSRMTCIDMAICSKIYEKFVRSRDLVAANIWFNRLNL